MRLNRHDAPRPVATNAAHAAVAALLASTTPAALAAPTGTDGPAVVIVRVAKPWYAPRGVVLGQMRDTLPEYRALPGLVFKAYSFERDSGDYGGVYHWASRAQAQGWFDAAWFERVRKQRGVEPLVRVFDAPVAIDNVPGGVPATSEGPAVATLVEIAMPTGVSRAQLVAGFRAAVPEYQRVPGLLRKQFTVSDQGRFGGVYLWKDEAAARAWFNEAWQARVRQTYGSPARIEWFDTPLLQPGPGAAVLAP